VLFELIDSTKRRIMFDQALTAVEDKSPSAAIIWTTSYCQSFFFPRDCIAKLDFAKPPLWWKFQAIVTNLKDLATIPKLLPIVLW
jgi:hypothetical protein